MSVWNVRLRRRPITITVAKVLQRWPGDGNESPRIKIIDTEGNQHIVEFFSLLNCSEKKWNEISEGSKLKLSAREILLPFAILILAKPRTTKIKKAASPESPYYYRWSCFFCGSSGILTYEGYEEPLRIGENILKAHHEAKPNCSFRTFRIIDHNGQDKTEEFKQIMGFILG